MILFALFFRLIFIMLGIAMLVVILMSARAPGIAWREREKLLDFLGVSAREPLNQVLAWLHTGGGGFGQAFDCMGAYDLYTLMSMRLAVPALACAAPMAALFALAFVSFVYKRAECAWGLRSLYATRRMLSIATGVLLFALLCAALQTGKPVSHVTALCEFALCAVTGARLALSFAGGGR